MRNRHFVLLAAAIVAAACADAGPAQPEVGVEAQAYLTEALDVMQYNSVRRRVIDWPAFRRAAERDAGAVEAVSVADVHPVIVEALSRLGDGHSFFRAADGREVHPSSSVVFGGPPQDPARSAAGPDEPEPVRRLAPGIGYARIEAFQGGGRVGDARARDVQAAMATIAAAGTCGWVVDLRGNGGGNMWPMLASVGPLLGEGAVGYFLDPDGMLTPWIYEDGGAGLDEGAIAGVDRPWSPRTRPWVAVLTDERTASAGEAVAVAFRGRDRTRSFGAATYGVSTGNAAFQLSDGSVIFLTVATMVDRDGRVYGGSLEPDEPVADEPVTGEPSGLASPDAVLAAAVSWLEGRDCS